MTRYDSRTVWRRSAQTKRKHWYYSLYLSIISLAFPLDTGPPCFLKRVLFLGFWPAVTLTQLFPSYWQFGGSDLVVPRRLCSNQQGEVGMPHFPQFKTCAFRRLHSKACDKDFQIGLAPNLHSALELSKFRYRPLYIQLVSRTRHLVSKSLRHL